MRKGGQEEEERRTRGGEREMRKGGQEEEERRTRGGEREMRKGGQEEEERTRGGGRERKGKGGEEIRGREEEREKRKGRRGGNMRKLADHVHPLPWHFGKKCSPPCMPSCPHSSQASVAHALLSGQSNWQLSQMQGGWYGEQPMRGGWGRKCRYLCVPIYLPLTISGCLMCGNRCLALSR